MHPHGEYGANCLHCGIEYKTLTRIYVHEKDLKIRDPIYKQCVNSTKRKHNTINHLMVNEDNFTMAFDDRVVNFMNMQQTTFYFDNNFHYACKTYAPSINYHPI